MMLDLAGYGTSMFLVACRVGACFMVMPGFSSARVPARVRLLAALAVSATITPVLVAAETVENAQAFDVAALIFQETVIGGLLGLIARVHIAALEFSATAIASYIGLAGLNAGIDNEDAAPTLALLVTAAATLLVLLLDLHKVLIATLVESYATLPIGAGANASSTLQMLTGAVQSAFVLALQISGPFIVYGVIVNAMFGILGKLIPQVPSYFLSVPFLLAGGLLLLYFLSGEMLLVFARGLAASLAQL
jgi:flagellar biosynthetic protein FliR